MLDAKAADSGREPRIHGARGEIEIEIERNDGWLDVNVTTHNFLQLLHFFEVRTGPHVWHTGAAIFRRPVSNIRKIIVRFPPCSLGTHFGVFLVHFLKGSN